MYFSDKTKFFKRFFLRKRENSVFLVRKTIETLVFCYVSIMSRVMNPISRA